MNAIGFTGTRKGTTAAQKATLAILLGSLVAKGTLFHHGDCLGADAEAADTVMALQNGPWGCVVHPPNNWASRALKPGRILPPADYLVRNQHIVDACEVLVACPGTKAEEQRSSTWATVRYARRRGCPIKIIFPDGTIKEETP